MARQPQDRGRASSVLSGDVSGFRVTSGDIVATDPAARWEPVHRLEERIHKSTGLDDILQTAVEELGAQLSLDRCALLRLGPTGEFVSTVTQYCARGVARIEPDLAIPRLHGLDRFLARRGELILDDTSQNAQTRTLYSREFDELGTRSLVCLPVCVEGVSKAVLTMAAVKQSRLWEEEEIAVGRAVAERLAAAIKQDELFRQIRESAREADALYRASNMLVDPVGVDQMYEQILDAVADVFGHPAASIWLVDDERRKAVLSYTRGDVPVDSPRSLNIDGVGLIPLAIRTGTAVNCPDVSRESRYFPGPQATRSELIVPLKVDGVVLAVFNVESSRIGTFTERDERILSSFAERAARAVERERLYNQVQRAADRERLISRITSLLNQSLDAQPIFQELVEQLGRHLGVNRCVIAQADSHRHTVAITHQYATDCLPVPAGLPFSKYRPIYDALVHGPVISADVMTDPAIEAGVRDAFQDFGTRGFLAIPVSDRAGLRVLIACTTTTPR
ncbi:MAG TPA: GAF domain-containing protein, partial [Blastocatellia bacterium]|nr:GAF domain-containing protein [Blastocatellia bacterium]